MRISSNKISALFDYYHKELESIRSRAEVEALFATAVEHYLGIQKIDLPKKLEENLNESEVLKIYDCCKELKKNIPIQYILGEAWFLGLKLKVN